MTVRAGRRHHLLRLYHTDVWQFRWPFRLMAVGDFFDLLVDGQGVRRAQHVAGSNALHAKRRGLGRFVTKRMEHGAYIRVTRVE